MRDDAEEGEERWWEVAMRRWSSRQVVCKAVEMGEGGACSVARRKGGGMRSGCGKTCAAPEEVCRGGRSIVVVVTVPSSKGSLLLQERECVCRVWQFCAGAHHAREGREKGTKIVSE